MRITGGILCNRRIPDPRGGVRPTLERTREAVFGMLGEQIVGARALDLFAGSGALGLEAWSRGAREVTWVEQNPRTFRELKRTVEILCDDPARPAVCVRRDALAFIRDRDARVPFDVIFMDPPYADAALLQKALKAISEGATLRSAGLVVIEQPADQPVYQDPAWYIEKNRTYGRTRILICKPRHPTPDTRNLPHE